MRILITISREWRDYRVVRDVLTGLYTRHDHAVLVHGDAPKGDRDAARIWSELGGTTEPTPADWAKHGKAAGPIRNAAMVKSEPELVLAFIHGASAGASHLARIADEAKLCVARWTEAA